MKLIYSQGFNKNERLEWKPVVFSNIVQSFRTIFEAMTELNYEFDNPDNEVRFESHRNYCLLLHTASHLAWMVSVVVESEDLCSAMKPGLDRGTDLPLKTATKQEIKGDGVG